MASLENMSINVGMEQLVHDVFASAVEAMWRQYGLQVKSIDVEWRDLSTLANRELVVHSLSVKTTSYPHDKKLKPDVVA